MQVTPTLFNYARAVYNAPMHVCKDHILINDEGRSEILQAQRKLSAADIVVLKEALPCPA